MEKRNYLRSLAQTIEPIFQVGKGGVSEAFCQGVSEALRKRELIKITVLNNSETDVKSLAVEIADRTQSEIVCTIGHKIVLYKRSDLKGINHVI